jgi:hypothetical protein
MGRVRVVYFHVWSSECGSPHLCRLGTMSVGPCGTSIDYILAHTGFMGSRKLSRFDDVIPSFYAKTMYPSYA